VSRGTRHIYWFKDMSRCSSCSWDESLWTTHFIYKSV
jgi:hypothetical protein